MQTEVTVTKMTYAERHANVRQLADEAQLPAREVKP